MSNVCASCKWLVNSTIHVMHYGTLPDYRCGRNPKTGKALTGGKSARCVNARVNAKGKRGKSLECKHWKEAVHAEHP